MHPDESLNCLKLLLINRTFFFLLGSELVKLETEHDAPRKSLFVYIGTASTRWTEWHLSLVTFMNHSNTNREHLAFAVSNV